MYTIKVDGQEVYSPALLNEPEQQLLSISLQLEIDTPGSLSFIIPPGHEIHGNIHKLKSIVTMEWDGKEIFRGRVLEEKTDAFNQREVYCEGELSYLLDSVVRPFTFEGTTRAFIERVIAIHNEQVEEYKRFTLGDFSALTDNTVIPLESYGYADTLSAIRAVLEPYEGYLFARYENGVHYLDFVAAYEADEGQVIEFGVNLVDLDNQTAAEELCTVLLPIGGMLEDGTTVTIASVNNGKDTIENARAISQYGRIVKTYAFDDVTDPATLLQKAREKLDSMSFAETLILQAVDMHLLDEEKGIILPGRRVLIRTAPHGIDNQRKLCTALELDPENPEKATYTFGKPEKTQSGAAALIASRVEQHTRSVQMLYKHYTETDYTAQIQAGLLDKQGEYLSQARFDIDGIAAKMLLMAKKKELDELTGEFNTLETNVSISADGLREIIQRNDKTISELKATIDGLEHWVTDSDGNIAELTNTVRGLESKVTTADGKVSILTNTADGLTSTLLSQGGDVAQFKTRIDEISATVRDTNGSIGSLSVKADSVTAKVKGVNDQVSNLAVTADGLSYTLTKQGQELASLKALIDEISLTVNDTNGAMGQFVVSSNRIAGKLNDANGKLTALQELTEEQFRVVLGDIETVEGDIKTITGSTLWQDRTKIVSAVGKVSTLEGNISTITGSTLWQDRANIAGVVGKMSVGADGKIYIKSGSGLMITKGSASYGVYDSNNLTAGIIVNKINGGTAVIKAERIDLQGYVTADELATAKAAISNLTSGITVATSLKATLLSAATGFVYQGVSAVWTERQVVNDVTLSVKKANIPVFNTNGTFIQNVEVVTSVSINKTTEKAKFMTAAAS